MKTFRCQNCGAQINIDSTNDNIITCPECGKRYVKSSDSAKKQNTSISEIDKLFIRARDMERDGRFNDAIYYYDKILDIDPFNEKARHSIGYLKSIQIKPNDKPKPKKSKAVAGLLCLFFGYIGVHEFYIGKTKLGILYIVFTLFNVMISPLLFAIPIFGVFIGGTLIGAEALILLIRAIMLFASKDEIFYD